jgi:putative selenium metabolism hydrolase
MAKSSRFCTFLSMQISHAAIASEAAASREAVTALLRDLIATPSLSTAEGAVTDRLAYEARELGADDVIIDERGNFVARFGSGPRTLLFDSHIDTVDVGDRAEWSRDPFDPYMERSATGNIIHGRGASDNKAGIASMLHGASLWRRIDPSDDVSLWVVGSVQEEACDGLSLYELLMSGLIPRPDAVVLGEATNGQVFRGNRGRIEAYVRVHGATCHASAPERGSNPVTTLAPVIAEIDRLNNRLSSESFLGKGTIALTKIECETPSFNAVPGSATLYVDRRLSQEETPQGALDELRAIVAELGIDADVEVMHYESVSYTGAKMQQAKEFPTWVNPENHPLTIAGIQATGFTSRPRSDSSHWVFSTNGVASMGKLDIPTIGYGPANEIHAHTAHDQCPQDDLVEALRWYAAFPSLYVTAKDA